MDVTNQFLNDLTNDQNANFDVLNQPFDDAVNNDKKDGEQDTATEPKDETQEGEHIIKPKNRREVRLMRKLEEERESAKFLAAKLEAREEARKALNEESDYLKGIERIYGTETAEAQMATELLKKAILGAKEDARREAVAEYKAERQREEDQVRNAARALDGFVEEIEDTYGVSLTEAQENSFTQLLTKMSPKGQDGKVTAYADPHAVWEIFQDRLKRREPDTRAKDISARSMVQSGAPQQTNLQDDVHLRVLRDQGII